MVLALFVFQIERTAAVNGPSAELVGFSKRRATSSTASRPSSQMFPSPPAVPQTIQANNAAPHSLGYSNSSPGYAFPLVAPLPALSQPAGEMGSPGIGTASSHAASTIEMAGRGLLGLPMSGTSYYTPS